MEHNEPHQDNDIAGCLIELLETPATDIKRRGAIQANLGRIYKTQGLLNEAITAYLQAIMLAPEVGSHWSGFADTIKYAVFSQPNTHIRQAIIDAFRIPQVDPQMLAIPGLSILSLSPLYGSSDPTILKDPLLRLLLQNCILPDATFEEWMARLRAEALLGNVRLPPQFLQALSTQCALNEYIYPETAQETEELKKDHDPLVIACYRATSTTQKNEPNAQHIAKLNAITDAVSQKVQEQYEENPYPSWKHLPTMAPKGSMHILQQALPLAAIPKMASTPDILVAGCGTGQHAITTAMRHANCQVLALDLSMTSLLYAATKAKELNIDNITFIQGDLLDVQLLKRKFDIIECSGVLHHMEDPFKGLKALTQVLKPNGVMAIGLYSEIARQDVVVARQYIREMGLMPNLEGIRQCRSALRELPACSSLVQSVDFYTVSGCRDLLFHVQEHRFTLLQIESMLTQLKLRIVGLEIKAPNVLKEYVSLFPKDPTANNLKNWHEYEKKHPDTFMGMYQLWVTPS